MRWLLPLALLLGCSVDPAPAGQVGLPAVACSIPNPGTAEALVVLTEPSAESSRLVAVPIGPDGPDLAATATLATLPHARGFAPRVRVVGDDRLALAIPVGGRRSSPATITLNDRVLDTAAFELQDPLLLDGCAAWLRGALVPALPGVQSALDFELVTTLGVAPIFTTQATWLQVLGAAPHPDGPSLVLYELQPDGAALIELSLAGAERARIDLGPGFARELTLTDRRVDLVHFPAGTALRLGLDGTRDVLADGLPADASLRADGTTLHRERTDPLGRTNPLAVTPAGLLRQRFDPAGDRLLLNDRPLHAADVHGSWVGTR